MTTAPDIRLRDVSLACAALAFALYCFTLMPSFGWGDSADLAMRMVDSSDLTFRGTHRDYVLYRAIGSVFQALPVGDAGMRANLMSAFFGAVTVGLVAFLSGLLAQRPLAAAAAGITLAVSHTFWLMAVMTEVYTFNATLILACYVCVALWWQHQRPALLIAAAFFAGLALNHHATGLVLAATIAPLLLMRIRRVPLGGLALAALVFVAASYPYWQIALYHWRAGWTLLSAMNLDAPSNTFFTSSPLRELLKFGAYSTYNFLGLGVVLAAIGLVQLWRRRLFAMLPPMLWLALVVYVGVTSSIPDKFNIYVLIYPVLAIVAGIGATHISPRFMRASLILALLALVPPLGYVASIHTARALGVDLVAARTLPYRDNDWYFMWPGKRGDDGPRRYSEEAFAALDKNAVVIADYSLWRPLLFLQTAEHQRRDVTLLWSEPLAWKGPIAKAVEAIPCTKPVYLATDTPAEYYQLWELKKRYGFVRKGLVLQLLRPACANK